MPYKLTCFEMKFSFIIFELHYGKIVLTIKYFFSFNICFELIEIFIEIYCWHSIWFVRVYKVYHTEIILDCIYCVACINWICWEPSTKGIFCAHTHISYIGSNEFCIGILWIQYENMYVYFTGYLLNLYVGSSLMGLFHWNRLLFR